MRDHENYINWNCFTEVPSCGRTYFVNYSYLRWNVPFFIHEWRYKIDVWNNFRNIFLRGANLLKVTVEVNERYSFWLGTIKRNNFCHWIVLIRFIHTAWQTDKRDMIEEILLHHPQQSSQNIEEVIIIWNNQFFSHWSQTKRKNYRMEACSEC